MTRFSLPLLFALTGCVQAADDTASGGDGGDGGDGGSGTEDCSNGSDDDGDGAVDCDDSDCINADECSGSGSSYKITINEFMADNVETVADETGSFDDWIELYNYGDEAVDLTGFTLSDDLSQPGRHTMGAVTIEAGEYLLLWADGTPDEGERHLVFALEKNGEEIGLFDPTGRPLTQLVFEAQVTDWAAARETDASDTWVLTETPTPGASNGG